MTPRFKTISAAVISGVLIGIAASLLKWLIRQISLLCTGEFNSDGVNWSLLILPVVGIVLTWMLVRYVFRHPLEHATEQLKGMIAAKRPDLPGKITVAPILASSVTLGFGGSAGSEGPIAFAGSAIGDWVSRLLGLDNQHRLLLLACGAGAGIAAIFKAPMGGMLFTLEVLSMSLITPGVMMLILMCLSSSLVCFLLSGLRPDMTFIHASAFTASDLLPTVILGAICGIYSVYYMKTGLLTRRGLERIGSGWWRSLVSGGILAVALFCFPALYGEGYSLMSTVMNGEPTVLLHGMPFSLDRNLLWALAGILLSKPFACYATNSGGGVAGDFAPTLFAGCMLGTMFALGAEAIGVHNLAVGNYALVGMAGVMAGAIRAPFMAILLTVEMSFSSSLLFPVVVCVIISYFTSVALVRRF